MDGQHLFPRPNVYALVWLQHAEPAEAGHGASFSFLELRRSSAYWNFCFGYVCGLLQGQILDSSFFRLKTTTISDALIVLTVIVSMLIVYCMNMMINLSLIKYVSYCHLLKSIRAPTYQFQKTLLTSRYGSCLRSLMSSELRRV